MGRKKPKPDGEKPKRRPRRSPRPPARTCPSRGRSKESCGGSSARRGPAGTRIRRPAGPRRSWPAPTGQEIRKVAWNWRTKPSPSGPTAPTPTSCWPNTLPAARKPSACMKRAWRPASGPSAPRRFRRDAGHFWVALETRPYMRARLGLAHVLWTVGRRDEAVQHLQDMLRLNPGDNQGVRYTLAGFLLFLDRDDDLDQLLRQYPDEDSAAWAYTRALLAFRQQGDTIEARRLLKAARKTNKHVPAYLLGAEVPARPAAALLSAPATRAKPLEYIGSFMAGWKSTPGAVAWLRANAVSGKKKPATPEPKARWPPSRSG